MNESLNSNEIDPEVNSQNDSGNCQTQLYQGALMENDPEITDQAFEGDHDTLEALADDSLKMESEGQDEDIDEKLFDASEPSEEAKELLPNAELNGQKKEDPKHNEQFDAFILELKSIPNLENKLQKVIEFMEASLSQNGQPHFKNFWEARNISLEIFKENINPIIRSQLWLKYSELSKEARRLKEILDEQSAFATEQIEIAIQALEKDIEQCDEQIQKMPSIEFPSFSHFFKDKAVFYQNIQRELNLLNAQASRINALRKELIKTEMRVRHKNKFFQRLSVIGDKVFPRRKEAIKEISKQFTSDIESFISTNFSDKNIEDSFFALREEIKALQGLAKLLTLNTHSFTHTRIHLSECWDKIKLFEKERKKQRAQLKMSFKQNADAVLEKIREFTEAFNAGTLSIQDANKQIDSIVIFMREVDLGRDELKYLREELAQARKLLTDKVKVAEQERANQENERENLRKKKIDGLKEEIELLSKEIEALEYDQLIQRRDALVEKISQSGLNKIEKHEIDRLMKSLRNTITDALSEKKEKSLMALSDDTREALEKLKEILAERKERRREIKEQLEAFRKVSGASGLDFEQAMTYQSQVNLEKERLEKINQGIREIEEKINELEE